MWKEHLINYPFEIRRKRGGWVREAMDRSRNALTWENVEVEVSARDLEQNEQILKWRWLFSDDSRSFASRHSDRWERFLIQMGI